MRVSNCGISLQIEYWEKEKCQTIIKTRTTLARRTEQKWTLRKTIHAWRNRRCRWSAWRNTITIRRVARNTLLTTTLAWDSGTRLNWSEDARESHRTCRRQRNEKPLSSSGTNSDWNIGQWTGSVAIWIKVHLKHTCINIFDTALNNNVRLWLCPPREQKTIKYYCKVCFKRTLSDLLV